MKCENCGKNEVTFVYRSNVNGHVEEKHLCSDCAEKLGYTQRLGAQSQRMMQSFFGNSLFGNDFFDDFFSPMPSLLGRRMKMLEDPFDDFFAEMPALSASPVQQDQSRFAYLRQMNALKLEMKKAVHQENFERAAELRDQIRSLEAAHKEQKENK